MAVRQPGRSLAMTLAPVQLTPVNYVKSVQSLFQGEIADIPDRSLLSEDLIKRRFRDFNNVADKLKNIYSYTISRKLRTAVLNQFHGMPIVLGCTDVVISLETQWQQSGADIEQVAWDEVGPAGIARGFSWYSWKTEGKSTMHKMTQGILNAMIAHPEFGPAAVAWLLRGFVETCKFTIMKSVCNNLAAYPFQNFLKQTRDQTKDGAISAHQIYARHVKYFLGGAQQPELAMGRLAQAAQVENVKATNMIVSESALVQFKQHTQTDRQMRESIVHDEDGEVFQTANKMLALQYQPSVTSTFFSTNNEMQIFAAPAFRQRATDSIEKAEQPLLSAMTLGRAAPITIHPKRQRAPHPDNHAVSLLDVSDRRAHWEILQLAEGIEVTNYGFWFADPSSAKPRPWVLTELDALAKDQTMLGDIRKELELMRDCNSPTPKQQDLVGKAFRRASTMRNVPGWRNVHTLMTFANDGGVEKVGYCLSMGHIMEAFKPTRDILEEIRAFKRRYVHNQDELYSQFGRLLNLTGAQVRTTLEEEKETSFKDAMVTGANANERKVQLHAYMRRFGEGHADKPWDRPGAARGPAPRGGGGSSIAPSIVTSARPMDAVPPPLVGSPSGWRTPLLNVLLGRMPRPSFNAITALAPRIDELATPKSPLEQALKTINDRIVGYHQEKDAGKIDLTVSMLLEKLGTALDKVDEAKVKELATIFPTASELKAASRIGVDADWAPADAFRAGLRAAPTASLGLPSTAALGAGADVRGAVPPANEFWRFHLCPSRVEALQAVTQGIPSDELWMLLAILAQPMSVDALVRLARDGFPMVGGRFENHWMRLTTSAVLLVQPGSVRTHLSPMLVDYGYESEQQRTSVTGAFHIGNEFVDPNGVIEVPHYFPDKYMGGARATLIRSREEIVRRYTGQVSAWTDAAPNFYTDDLMFLPRPASETEDSFPQSVLFDPDPNDRSIRADNMFTRVSSCHAYLRALIGGDVIVGQASMQLLRHLTTRRHVDTNVAPFIELAFHKVRSDPDAHGHAGFTKGITGTGPLGAMNMNDEQTIALALDSSQAVSFPDPRELRQFLTA